MAESTPGAIALVLEKSDGGKVEIKAVHLLKDKNDVGGVRGGWPGKTVAVIPADVWEPLGKSKQDN